MNRDEFYDLLGRVYRRGVFHGGLIALFVAAVYLTVRG